MGKGTLELSTSTKAVMTIPFMMDTQIVKKAKDVRRSLMKQYNYLPTSITFHIYKQAIWIWAKADDSQLSMNI